MGLVQQQESRDCETHESFTEANHQAREGATQSLTDLPTPVASCVIVADAGEGAQQPRLPAACDRAASGWHARAAVERCFAVGRICEVALPDNSQPFRGQDSGEPIRQRISF